MYATHAPTIAAARTSSSRPRPTVVGFALVASLGGSMVVGCGGDAHGRDQRRMMTALTSARDAVCGCRDLDCAEQAERRLADYLLLHVDALKKIPAPDPTKVDPVASQAAQLDGELRACKHRLEEAARAS